MDFSRSVIIYLVDLYDAKKLKISISVLTENSVFHEEVGEVGPSSDILQWSVSYNFVFFWESQKQNVWASSGQG